MAAEGEKGDGGECRGVPANFRDHNNNERFVQVFYSSFCHLSSVTLAFRLSSTFVPNGFFIIIVHLFFFLSFLSVHGSSFLQSTTALPTLHAQSSMTFNILHRGDPSAKRQNSFQVSGLPRVISSDFSRGKHYKW
jgi:hypothetical protein